MVSERTGYPPEMLGLDLGLEADLGIDSIKRVEILGALQRAVPAPMAEAIKGQLETLTKAKTLRADRRPPRGARTGRPRARALGARRCGCAARAPGRP